jgi:multidrug efflux pump subunit AcrA (membrane-fusion protein)
LNALLRLSRQSNFMKKNIIQWLEKPKVVIPAVFIIAVIIGAVSYGFIGRAPVTTSSPDSNIPSPIGSTDNSVDLAFSKTGRLGALSVAVGSSVKKGDVLASLDAGDALGAVNQARGALELAKAQYASMNVQYANTKNQQDVLVENAFRTLLSSNLIATPKNSSVDVSSNRTPQISGTYTCNKEGSYEIDPYASNVESGYSFTFSGIEEGVGNVLYYTAQPLGSCGLFIQFPAGYYAGSVNWIVNIPNTKSASYATNKNAYDLAIATRDQVLKQFEANLGINGSSGANVAQASIDAAQGAYEAAQAAYRNNLIISPIDGVVTFVDSDLKIGQLVNTNKTVITVIMK